MAETPPKKRDIRSVLIAAVAIAGVCIFLLGALTILGPVLNPLFLPGGGSTFDNGECASAVSEALAPGGGQDSRGEFTLSVSGEVITAQNAAGLAELEGFTQRQSQLSETLAVDSSGVLHVYHVSERPARPRVANSSMSRLVIVEGYPSYSSIVRVCDVTTSRQLAAFMSNETTNAVAFTPDGQRFLLNEGRGMVSIYETDTARRLGRWDVRAGQQWRSTSQMTISPDGKLAAFGITDSPDNSVKVTVVMWEIDANRQVAALEAHTDRLISLVFSPDGTRLISYGMDRKIRVWGVLEAQK